MEELRIGSLPPRRSSSSLRPADLPGVGVGVESLPLPEAAFRWLFLLPYSGAEQGSRNYGDAVRTAVSVGAGGDDHHV